VSIGTQVTDRRANNRWARQFVRGLWARAARTVLIICFLGACPPFAHSAVQVLYEVQDLTDDTPGEDLWRYLYRVSGYAFQPGENFLRVLFPDETYGPILEDGIEVPDGWIAVVQVADTEIPDASFNAEGSSDTVSELLFTVPFAWQGLRTPGAQRFEILEYNPAQDDFELAVEGVTSTTPIPEPATAFLLAMGLALVVTLRSRQRTVRSA